MNFSDPSIQLEESEPSHGDDDDENRDSCALRQSEYDDSQGIVYGTMMDHNNPRSRMTRGYRTHNMTTTLVVSCRYRRRMDPDSKIWRFQMNHFTKANFVHDLRGAVSPNSQYLKASTD
jgi:hypothetical protein